MHDSTGVNTRQFRYVARQQLPGTRVDKQAIVTLVRHLIVIDDIQHQGRLATTGKPGCDNSRVYAA